MKLTYELVFTVLFVLIISAASFYLVSPISDNYWHYLLSMEMWKNPGFMFTANHTGTAELLVANFPVLHPPLFHLLLIPFVLLRIPVLLFLSFVILVIALLWKIESKAVPFLALSFFFVHFAIFGITDIPMAFLTLICVYFFEKNPALSGLSAALTALITPFGFMILGAYIVALLALKRGRILEKKYLLGIVLALLILVPWYARTTVLMQGDVLSAMTGRNFTDTMKPANVPFEAARPGRVMWDTTGYYPLPIDLLFYVGLIFTAIYLWRNGKKSFGPEHVFIILFAAAYFSMQALHIYAFALIRNYMVIFPFLAIQIARSIPPKYLKVAYSMTLLVFVFFMLNMSQYAFNQLDTAMTPICDQVNLRVVDDPIYVNAYHGWFTIYKCDFANPVVENESKWTLDMNKVQLYRTNLTNRTT